MKLKRKKNLKKEFWKIFSQYIRQRDKGICFICGLKRPWKKMQAGHCIPKVEGGLELYFHEQNVNCSCYRCNINLGGNGALYARRIKQVYGEEVLNKLYEIYDRRGNYKITDEEYIKLIEHYSAKLE
jgi:Bacteriophage Lambda NinG protein